MESNLSFFSLPFNDNADVDFTLPSQGSLLSADDFLAQFLSGDELLEEPDLNGPTTLHCEICRKQFDNAKKYYGHLRVHSKDNLWTCDKCPNAKFSTKQHLMKHSLTHKPLERVWRCPQCVMSFEALSRLQQHLFAKHSHYRPHKCDKCEMSFHKLSDLKKHKDIHDGIKRHACKECAATFSDVSNMRRHMLTHGTEKLYPCPGCGNRYQQLASMKRHSKNCALVKQEGLVDKTIRKSCCRVCGKAFLYKSALLEHTVREHSNNPPPPNVSSDKSNELQTETRVSNNTTQINTNNIHTHVNTHSNIDTNLVSNHSMSISNLMVNTSHNINANTNPPLNILSNTIHNTNTHNHTNPINIERNQTVDNIVDDILSVEDEYLRDPMSNQMLNYNQSEAECHENLISQIELLKEMNHMHILDDELLCHDLDFDSFQSMCNTNDMDYTDRNELLFDIPDGRSMDQDIMNALYQVRGDLPDLLNEPDILNTTEKVNDFLVNPGVSVNECATIFESDVDLEASTNLAANLNQLIGENSVQYISTEHDDTFIISLNSEIDAEQLTDMLNIGSVQESNKSQELTKKEERIESTHQPMIVTVEKMPDKNIILKSSNQALIQPISVKVEPNKGNDNKVPNASEETPKNVKIKKKKRVYYVCRKCNKIFNRKDNYKSHRATHEASLQRHVCGVCSQRFSYRSTLNKHVRRAHTPLVSAAHACRQCARNYRAAWMLKRHIARDHELVLQFKCSQEECGKRFYSRANLDVHERFHRDERPYPCQRCGRSFHMMSHLKRHVSSLHNTTTQAKKEAEVKNKSNQKTLVGSLLIINQL